MFIGCERGWKGERKEEGSRTEDIFFTFSGVRGVGEGKEADLDERIDKVLKIYCYSILAKIIFCQRDNRLLRSHSIFNATKCLYNFPTKT